jgi:hypothetical protein
MPVGLDCRCVGAEDAEVGSIAAARAKPKPESRPFDYRNLEKSSEILAARLRSLVVPSISHSLVLFRAPVPSSAVFACQGWLKLPRAGSHGRTCPSSSTHVISYLISPRCASANELPLPRIMKL